MVNRPKWRVSLAPTLALALAAVFLSACGGSGGDTTAAGETTAAQSEETTAAPEEIKALELEKETAEAEAEQAKLEAQKERREANRAAARQAKKNAAQAQMAQAAAKAEVAEEEAEAEQSSAPPSVVGLPLPAAKSALRSAGFTTAAVNTDTLFGIVNEDNYTICRQDPPRGTVVKVLAQKYGC